VAVSQLLIAHRDKSGEVEYLSTIMRDLTEQKRTEHALRQREETLRMAQQVGNVGSWERDLETDTLRWSEQIFRIVDRDPQTFEITRLRWLPGGHTPQLLRPRAT